MSAELKTVTTRKFAEANNLALPRLRKLVREDRDIRIAFTRKNVNHYDLAALDKWLVENKYKFSATAVYSPSQNGEMFYCSHRSHYVSTGKRSNKMSLCCVSCEKSIQSHTVVSKQKASDKYKNIDPAVKKVKKAMDDMLLKRELKAIDDMDNWMHE